MTSMALQMRTLASSTRSATRKKEERDLDDRIAAWREREKEVAKRAITQLPAAIKCVAEKGKSLLVVQVQVTRPYVGAEIADTYKVLGQWTFPHLLESETPPQHEYLSLHKIRNLRDKARLIARWALQKGFTVQFCEWDTRLGREYVEHHNVFTVDEVAMPVIIGHHRGGAVQEGFMLAW